MFLFTALNEYTYNDAFSMTFFWCLLIGVGCVAGFYVIICIIYKILDSIDSIDNADSVAGLLAIIFGMVSIAIPIICGFPIYKEEAKNAEKWYEYYASEKCETYYDEIYSITRENEAYGKFSLGCGTVSEKVYYYFYIKIENDTYALKKIENKNNVYIVETEDTHWYITQNKKANSDTIYYNIIVPKGTMIQSFNG